jgi:hypothetical protein
LRPLAPVAARTCEPEHDVNAERRLDERWRAGGANDARRGGAHVTVPRRQLLGVLRRAGHHKIARSTLDSATGIVFGDDSRIVALSVAKVYAAPGGEGATITVALARA